MSHLFKIGGAITIILGILVATSILPIIPAQSLVSQSVCLQSIVSQVTVCDVGMSLIDSINFEGYTLRGAGYPIYVNTPSSSSTLQGNLKVYYFLSSGATLTSHSIAYCSTTTTGTCSPNSALSTSLLTSNAGVKYIQAPSPKMSAGAKYIFMASITDSKGVKSSMQGSLIPTSPSSTFTATATTLEGTFTLSGTNAVSGIDVSSQEYVKFKVSVSSSLSPISGIKIVLSNGQTIQMTQLGSTVSGDWVHSIKFAAGSYTATGTISYQGGGEQTAFSVRVASLEPEKVTVTVQSTSCTYSTKTVGDIVYVCEKPPVVTITVSTSSTITTTSGTQTGTTTSVVTSETTATTQTDVGDESGGGAGLDFGNIFLGIFLIVIGGVVFTRKGGR